VVFVRIGSVSSIETELASRDARVVPADGVSIRPGSFHHAPLPRWQ
jgi:hypothetical protein